MIESFSEFFAEHRYWATLLLVGIAYLFKNTLRNSTEERDAHFIINLVIGVLIAFVIYANIKDFL